MSNAVNPGDVGGVLQAYLSITRGRLAHAAVSMGDAGYFEDKGGRGLHWSGLLTLWPHGQICRPDIWWHAVCIELAGEVFWRLQTARSLHVFFSHCWFTFVYSSVMLLQRVMTRMTGGCMHEAGTTAEHDVRQFPSAHCSGHCSGTLLLRPVPSSSVGSSS